MKKLAVILGTFLILGLVLAGCAPASGQTISTVNNQQNGIWISATGTVNVAPDIANISLGIQSEQPTVQAAQAAAIDAMNKIMDVLKANNIDTKDIQTQQYNISQVLRYDNVTGRSVVTGYQVSNIVNVTIRNIADTGKIVDEVAAAGGDLTRINGISFSVDQPDQYYAQAREKAMTDAKNQAQQLASLGGVTLGRITYISTSTPSVPSPIYYSRDMAAAAPSTPINPGETEISISVQVVFSIS